MKSFLSVLDSIRRIVLSLVSILSEIIVPDADGMSLISDMRIQLTTGYVLEIRRTTPFLMLLKIADIQK